MRGDHVNQDLKINGLLCKHLKRVGAQWWADGVSLVWHNWADGCRNEKCPHKYPVSHSLRGSDLELASLNSRLEINVDSVLMPDRQSGSEVSAQRDQ